MGWYFKRFTIPANTSRPDWISEKLNFSHGCLKGVSIFLPSTSNPWQVGVRIKTPDLVLIPAMTEGSDSWLRSQTWDIDMQFHFNCPLKKVSPNTFVIEATNTTGDDVKMQVGFHVVTVQDEVNEKLYQIQNALEAMREASRYPDLEKEIRRVVQLLGGTYDEKQN